MGRAAEMVSASLIGLSILILAIKPLQTQARDAGDDCMATVDIGEVSIIDDKTVLPAARRSVPITRNSLTDVPIW